MEAVLSVDVGATWLRAALVDPETLSVLKLVRKPTPQSGRRESISGALRDAVREAVAGNRVRRSAGVATIGPLDAKRGVILRAPNVAGRPEMVDVVGPVIEAGGVEEVFVLNDCNAAAIAEWMARRPRGIEDLLYVTVSTGIGAGCVLSSKPLLGRRGNAMELGHVVVDPSGYMGCGCGGRGHWEAYASGGNMLSFARRLLEDGLIPRSSALAEYLASGGRDPSEAFRLHRSGDRGAAELFARLAEFHAAGVASAVNALDPEVLVLGGSVYLSNKDFFVGSVIPRLDSYLILEAPAVEDPAFGEHSPVVGAAVAALLGIEEARAGQRR
ncbi:MAG: ROK family protein [Candidatus Caldarchaeales archaeon]